MSRLPVVSGEKLIKLLEKLGYSVVRQRGSHVRLEKSTPMGTHKITVPYHNEIAKGTLNDILNKVSLWNGVPKEELIEMLKKL
ncbi:type II toxin-antitoxin system HicA family toxin [Thermococcus sp.]|uniref:type II toxin-antitoxin system HicA family toxin n=1 Tax=Thermococcus sp. TaxID=35749 RepID=UPI002632C971|nr:type II toxin-antitoxin system HicA family toxin [Thermococcus sp.]